MSAVIQSGELKTPVLIRKRTDVPTMGTGMVENYSDGIEAWAKISPVGNALFFGTQQVGTNVTDHILIRRDDDRGLTPVEITGDHVVDDEVDMLRYRVRRASDVQGARWAVLLEVELLGKIPQP